MATLRDRVLRRVFHTYWRFQRGMTLGVRGLVLDPDRRVFLILHTYVPGWQLPGGGVEVGETVLEALERELKEEGNISLAAPPRLHGIFLQRAVSRRDHVALFVAETYAQPALPAPNREIAACGWFARDALPADTTPGTRRRIDEVLAGAPPAVDW
jgi:8-oxo-dGTP pyrophosphatase MutT (NUDIX family)